jgi:uncharacterized protein DUF4157
LIPAKVTIGRPNDIYEQEADRVAARPSPIALQRDEAAPPAAATAILQQSQASNRPPRPSDAGAQMSKMLEVARKEATGQKGKCYAAVAQYIRNAGGYGDILDIRLDERFAGFTLYALQFTEAVEKIGAASLGLEKVNGNPMNAGAGTILVLKGHKDLHISEAYGDISVIDGKQGSTLLCYNDGRMILPGPVAIWEGDGKYAATVAGMYKPVSRSASAAVPEPAPTNIAPGTVPAVQPKRQPGRSLTPPAPPSASFSGGSDSSQDHVSSVVQDALSGSGRPLDPQIRGFMEPRFNRDFGQVRVHVDECAAASAGAVSALAYTVGRDIVFGMAQYAPQTDRGKKLLAHELTHVVQQTPDDGQLSDASPHVLQRQEDLELRVPEATLPQKKKLSLFPPGKEPHLVLKDFCRQKILAEGTCEYLATHSKWICCDPARGYKRLGVQTSEAEPGKTCKAEKWTPIFTCDSNCAKALANGCDNDDHWMALPSKTFKRGKCGDRYTICSGGKQTWGYVRDNSSTKNFYEVSPGIQKALGVKPGDTFAGAVYPPDADARLVEIDPCCKWPPFIVPDWKLRLPGEDEA